MHELCADQAGNLTHAHINFCVEHPKRRWDIHLITCYTLMRRVQTYEIANWQWSWGIFDEAHYFKDLKFVGSSVASEAKFVSKCKLQ
jgi:hypothetical protein